MSAVFRPQGVKSFFFFFFFFFFEVSLWFKSFQTNTFYVNKQIRLYESKILLSLNMKHI